MDNISVLLKYFPQITEDQQAQFLLLGDLYRHWNSRINLISRKDIDHLYEHHVLHSLYIAHLVSFVHGTKVLDAGTGGGFPGIPLAIFFPDSNFHLVDSIGKKISAVKAIAGSLGLKNVTAERNRVEKLKGMYDFIVARAVTELEQLYGWLQGRISSDHRNMPDKTGGGLHNGILYLKGGDTDKEIQKLKVKTKVFDIKNFFTEKFFEMKKVVYIPTG
jgi:16S rRNA (guanine527-N7)-methyltransferase